MIRLEKLKSIPPWEWPPEVKTDLLEVLRDEHAVEPELVLAAELAGNDVVVDDELVAALLGVLTSPARPESARGVAAIALGPVLETADTTGFDFPDDVPITEATFVALRKTLRTIFSDPTLPKKVRRLVLEASVRAPEPWHQQAVREAYASDDPEWKLTAVFCMAYVRGFDDEILESLESKDPKIHFEAVIAAGNSELDAAWDHVSALVVRKTKKPLLLAAIEAATSIRPEEAMELVEPFLDSKDEEIAEAAEDALAMAEGLAGMLDEEDGEEDGEEGEDDEGGEDGDGKKLLH